MTEEKLSKPQRQKIPLDQLLAEWETCEYRTHPPADMAIWDKWYVTECPAYEPDNGPLNHAQWNAIQTLATQERQKQPRGALTQSKHLFAKTDPGHTNDA